jgi:hypothetical protein
MFETLEVNEWINQMLLRNVPFDNWQFIWPALVVGDEINTFVTQVCTKVRAGTFTGHLVIDVPTTRVEKEMRGKKSTLLTVWNTYGAVDCIMNAYMTLEAKSIQIETLREGYIENATSRITGEGYRRIVWPTMDTSDDPRSWPQVPPNAAMHNRTSSLLCKAVFSLV